MSEYITVNGEKHEVRIHTPSDGRVYVDEDQVIKELRVKKGEFIRIYESNKKFRALKAKLAARRGHPQ